MEGYVAYDDAAKGPLPGILVVPDWMGMSQFARDKADQLAKQGYVAMAVDVYGKGRAPEADSQGSWSACRKNSRATEAAPCVRI